MDTLVLTIDKITGILSMKGGKNCTEEQCLTWQSTFIYMYMYIHVQITQTG